jgi:hypothetical protein
MTALFDEVSVWKRHDCEMLALAEASVPPDEVRAMVLPRVERAFLRAKKTHAHVREARSMMLVAVNKFLGEHYYVLPRRKATVEGWYKRYLKGYQKWYRRVAAEERRIRRRKEKNGQSGNALAEALRLVSPELYEDHEP